MGDRTLKAVVQIIQRAANCQGIMTGTDFRLVIGIIFPK